MLKLVKVETEFKAHSSYDCRWAEERTKFARRIAIEPDMRIRLVAAIEDHGRNRGRESLHNLGLSELWSCSRSASRFDLGPISQSRARTRGPCSVGPGGGQLRTQPPFRNGWARKPVVGGLTRLVLWLVKNAQLHTGTSIRSAFLGEREPEDRRAGVSCGGSHPKDIF